MHFQGAQCINIVFYHFQDVIALFPFMLAALDKMILDKKEGMFCTGMCREFVM